MKHLTIIICFAVIYILPHYAYAGCSHHEQPVNNVTIIHQPAFIQIIHKRASGTALSLAQSSLVCNTGTRKKQASVGVGQFNEADAIAIGTCMSVADDLTLNINGGYESGDSGVAASLHYEW